jgi:hypothetical protein
VFDLTRLYELRVTIGSYSKVLFADVGGSVSGVTLINTRAKSG